MRPFLIPILFVSFFAKLVSAAEYGYLIVSDSQDSEILKLEKGEYIQVLSYHSNNANGIGQLMYRNDSDSNWITIASGSADSFDADGLIRHFKAGQYQLQYRSTNSGHRAEMSYKIVRKDEYIYKNSNVARLGTSVGDKTISVLTSNDLINWVLSASFQINNTFQYVRVRIEE